MLNKLIENLNFLLNSSERRKFIFIVFLSSFVSIFEIASLVLILPFVGMAINSDIIFDYRILVILYDFLEMEKSFDFVLFVGLVLIVVYIFRVFLNIFYQRYIALFSHGVVAKFRSSLLRHDLEMKYTEFSKVNTARLSNNILIESNNIYHIVYPILLVISESIVFLLFFLVLFINNPAVTAILIAFLSLVSIAILIFFKNVFKEKGKERNVLSEAISRMLGESISNIKYIKISNQIDRFSNYFKSMNERLSKINSEYMVMITIPKSVLEALGLITIVILVLYFSSQDSGEDALTILGLYIIAFYRLLPSINKIISSLNSIKFYGRSIDEVKNNLSLSSEKFERSDDVVFNDEIELCDISFKYNGVAVFENINLLIKKNDHIAFVGESGSGKTTLINIIISLITDVEGSIYIDSVKLDERNIHGWRERVGYIPQDVYLFDGTVAENIAFGAKVIDRNKVKRVLKTVKLDFMFESKNGLDTRVGDNAIQLSGGQKQRVAIARALYRDSDILVLDEATSALDGTTEREIMDDVYNICKNKTLIIIAHRLSTINRCDRVIKVDKGNLIE
jgi:ABC-type multidrug transport system fused ATPase/permease subunit